jgi:hypothetical protein
MFVAHDVLLDVAFGVARPRLVSLASTRALVDASRAAYQEGLASQGCANESGASANGASPNSASPNSAGRPRAGPGARPGVRLARIRFLPPVERADSTTVGMRWEASGVSVGLFPVLDADITLAAAGERTTMLALSGVCRSPCEHPGPALLNAPISAVAGAPGRPPNGPPAAPGLVADVAVRALLRYAASYLTQ